MLRAIAWTPRWIRVLDVARFFAIVEVPDGPVEFLENKNIAAAGGAGIQAAQFMARHGVGCVLTGRVGSNAFKTLEAAGISVVTDIGGTVQSAIAGFQPGSQPSAAGPNAASKSGLKA